MKVDAKIRNVTKPGANLFREWALPLYVFGARQASVRIHQVCAH